MTTTFARILSTGAVAAVLLVAAEGAASAHVTVAPASATPGSYATLTFTVPTESDTASTTKVAVYFPTGTPLASVSVQPQYGWHYQVSTVKLAKPITTDDGQVSQAVDRVVWTADSPKSAIKPGEFQTFNVSAGPLPGSGTLTFKTLQTYSDGSIVRWIDESQPGQPEPEHPAPALAITAAGETPAAASGSSPSATSAPTPASGTTAGAAKAALGVSIVALVVALASAATAWRRRRG